MARQRGLLPVYRCDGEFYAFYSKSQALAAESVGRVKLVKSRKGHINRVNLLKRPGDPEPSTHVPTGKKFTYREALPEIGRVMISLMRLAHDGSFVKW